MLVKFWEGIGSKLAERWASIAGPALVFWLGGLLAWARHAGGFDKLSSATGWLERQSTLGQILVVVGALLASVASGLIVDRLTFPALRILEGYWPEWTARVRDPAIKRKREKAIEEEAEWQRLAQEVLVEPPTATPEQAAEFTRLDARRVRRPSDPDRCLPTRVGNILRAAESRPLDKYGLDAVVIWPRLWLLMPDAVRGEVSSARVSLDAAVAAAIWGALFCAFAPWTLWAIPAGLGVAVVTVVMWIPNRAETFADLLESTYDLHRTALYEQLRWPLPTNPQHERAQGQLLTSYLLRGSAATAPTFTTPNDSTS